MGVVPVCIESYGSITDYFVRARCMGTVTTCSESYGSVTVLFVIRELDGIYSV